jgi:hypothetical protein
VCKGGVRRSRILALGYLAWDTGRARGGSGKEVNRSGAAGKRAQ